MISARSLTLQGSSRAVQKNFKKRNRMKQTLQFLTANQRVDSTAAVRYLNAGYARSWALLNCSRSHDLKKRLVWSYQKSEKRSIHPSQTFQARSYKMEVSWSTTLEIQHACKTLSPQLVDLLNLIYIWFLRLPRVDVLQKLRADHLNWPCTYTHLATIAPTH